MPEARRFTIRGRVQGVWFRDSTRKQAETLGLNGSAVNLASGAVQVLAFGPPASLDELAVWLHTGPRLADVAEVVEERVEWQDVSGFSIA